MEPIPPYHHNYYTNIENTQNQKNSHNITTPMHTKKRHGIKLAARDGPKPRPHNSHKPHQNRTHIRGPRSSSRAEYEEGEGIGGKGLGKC
jgi:hypothetical protein